MSDARLFGSKEEAVYDSETGAVLYRGIPGTAITQSTPLPKSATYAFCRIWGFRQTRYEGIMMTPDPKKFITQVVLPIEAT